MAKHGSVAKSIEISAESPESFDHAIKLGIDRAHDSVENLRSVWVKDQQVMVNDGKATKFRVWLKATFELN